MLWFPILQVNSYFCTSLSFILSLVVGLVLHTIGKKDVVLDYIRKYLVIAETIKERKVALPKGLFSYFMGKLLSHIGDFREAFSIEAFFDVPSCSIQLTGTHKNIQHAIEDLVLQIRRLLPQEKTTVTVTHTHTHTHFFSL
jgi:ribosome-associated translation inhibitor RaiA